jgi:hypothetical protein
MTTTSHERQSLANPTHATSPSDSKTRLWAGRILVAISVLFLLFDSVTKLILIQPVVDAMPTLGWPVSLARPLGIILLACLALYVIPRTSVLGAILLTGYLGGAVATNMRVGSPLATHILFPVYVGLMLWGGLYLRDARLRALIPFRGTDA